MAQQHTAGPWKTRTSPRGSVNNQIFQAKAEDLPIATIHLGTGTVINQIANARLIAAAPDLLAALEGLYNDAQDRGETTDDDGNEYDDWMFAREAIAKAKGEGNTP